MPFDPPSWPGGGSGGSPAGGEGELQYNDGGAFGANPDLTWSEANSALVLGSSENDTGNLIGGGVGTQLHIIAADGDTDHIGGEVNLLSGSGDGEQNGGDVEIVAGHANDDGDGGNVTISSGRSANADGGELAIYANPGGAVGGDGGQVIIHGGPGTTGGGPVIISAGEPDGYVAIYSGDNNQYLQLDSDGLQVGATKLGFYQGAAVTQPVVPLTAPSIQDVIDALVALGLVAQHD